MRVVVAVLVMMTPCMGQVLGQQPQAPRPPQAPPVDPKIVELEQRMKVVEAKLGIGPQVVKAVEVSVPTPVVMKATTPPPGPGDWIDVNGVWTPFNAVQTTTTIFQLNSTVQSSGSVCSGGSCSVQAPVQQRRIFRR